MPGMADPRPNPVPTGATALRTQGWQLPHLDEAEALAARFAAVTTGTRGDGLDVEALLGTLPLTRDVPAESIEVVLALVSGYFLRQGEQPGPPTSPYLREHQRWLGRVTWDWPCERRGRT